MAIHAGRGRGRCRGLAAGIGISLRTRERSGRSAGTLVGTVVGMVAALLAGLIPSYPIGSFLVLAIGLVVRHVTIFGHGHGLQRAIIDESQHRKPERLIMAQH